MDEPDHVKQNVDMLLEVGYTQKVVAQPFYFWVCIYIILSDIYLSSDSSKSEPFWLGFG